MIVKDNKYSSGSITVEAVVAISILAMLMASLATALHSFQKYNHYQLTRMRCTAASQAQLDSLATTGKPIPPQEIRRLWPYMDVEIHLEPGTDVWTGLTRVTSTASANAAGKRVHITLSQYMKMEKAEK